MCVVCVQELELYFTEPRQLLDMFDIIMLHSTYICVYVCVVCVQEVELYFTEPQQLLDIFDIIMLHSTYTCVSCVFRRWNYTLQSPDSCLTCLTSLCYIVHIHVFRVCSGAGIILYRAPTAA